MAITEKPNESYLQGLKTELKSSYQTQDEQIANTREVRELRRGSGLDKDFRLVDAEVRDPAMTDHGFRVAAMLGMDMPNILVTPSQQTDAMQKNATEREHFAAELLRLTGRTSYGMHTFMSLVDAAVNDGVGVGKFVHCRDIWDERYSLRIKNFKDDDGYSPTDDDSKGKSASRKYDEQTEEVKKVKGPPFRWRTVDAATFYPVFLGDDMAEVMEITERPLNSVFRQYRLGVNSTGDILGPEEMGQGISENDWHKAIGGSVEFIEHWDDTYVSYMVGPKEGGGTPKVVKQWKHGYGRHPYFPAYGLMMNHWRNRKVGWGINESMRALVELRSFLWTLMANVAARDTFPLIQEIPIDPSFLIGGDTGKPGGGIERWGLREILRNKNGGRYEVINMPQVAESLKIHMAQVDQAIARLETPRITGDIGGLEGAGFAISQVLNEMMIRHKPIALQIEASIEETIRFSWQLIRNKVKEKVWIYSPRDGKGWLGMGKDDLTDSVNIHVALDPKQPSGEMVLQRIVHESISAGTMSLDQGIEKLGRNPDEVRRGRRLDQIRQSDLYQKVSDQQLQAELGRGDLEKLTLQVEQMQQGGIVPGMTPEQMAQVQGQAQQGPAPQGALPGPTGSGMPQDPAAQSMRPGGLGSPGAAPGNPTAGQPIANALDAGAGQMGL